MRFDVCSSLRRGMDSRRIHDSSFYVRSASWPNVAERAEGPVDGDSREQEQLDVRKMEV